jgi:hypothetical protein
MVTGLIPKIFNYNVCVKIYAWNTIASIQRGYGADGNFANALLYKGAARSLIENALGGAGADDITGNQDANVLRGSGGSRSADGHRGESDRCHRAELRDELLDRELFCSLREAEALIETWRVHSNTRRPHSALGYRPLHRRWCCGQPRLL